jgi:hypothetical protein
MLTDFDEAKALAQAEGKQVIGIVAETPDQFSGYLLVDPSATDEQIHALAFEARHGRPMSGYEQAMTRLNEILQETRA